MAKNKLRNLAEIAAFPNVFQLRKDLKGRWNEEVFHNSNPITLELACGKGDYSLALAKKFPHRNFIGIDIKGARMWRGAKTALGENIPNVAFLRTYIDHIEEYFSEGETEEIWITFPDPQHGSGGDRKRLTSEKFLTRYQKILKPRGIIHLKTDDMFLYQFTLEKISECKGVVIISTADLYSENFVDEILGVKTFYEKRHLAMGKKIKYVKFRFGPAS